jgi:hypothetical protein
VTSGFFFLATEVFLLELRRGFGLDERLGRDFPALAGSFFLFLVFALARVFFPAPALGAVFFFLAFAFFFFMTIPPYRE